MFELTDNYFKYPDMTFIYDNKVYYVGYYSIKPRFKKENKLYYLEEKGKKNIITFNKLEDLLNYKINNKTLYQIFVNIELKEKKLMMYMNYSVIFML